MEKLQEPLWGQWYLDGRLYACGDTEVWALSRRGGSGRPCVVKCVRVPAGCEQELARLEAERRTQERMAECGGAVAVLDDLTVPETGPGGEPDGWLVLERLERLDCLAALLREGTRFTEPEVRRLACELLQTLCFAQRLNLVHRDIKPANIYRSPSGAYKLGDFGIAVRADGRELGDVAGTAAYMAPETAAGGSAGAQGDLYSLGIVLWQLLSGGFLPLTHDGSSYAEVQNSIAARLRGARLPRVPCRDPALRRAVARACSPDPRRRYKNAEQMLAALSRPKRMNLWPAACALALAAGLGAGFWLLPRPASREAAAGAADALRASSSAGESAPVSSAGQEPASSASSAAPAAVAERTEDTSGEQDVVHRYEVILQQLSWQDAKLWCESRGGHLATVTSPEESAQILSLLGQAGAEAVWLGADNRNTANGFTWVTGEPFDYAEWGAHEPNNDSGTEYYLMLVDKQDEGWVWNDSRDDGLSMFTMGRCGFVCEWEGDTP